MEKYSHILCIEENTKISILAGTVCIKDIRSGTEIISYDAKTGLEAIDIVTAISKSMHSQCAIVTFENGAALRATKDHPLFVKDKGWCAVDVYGIKEMYGVKVKQLVEGDECLFFKDGKFIHTKVESIEIQDCSEPFYCLSTQDTHCFLANGVVVHDVEISRFSEEQLKCEYVSYLK